MAPPEDSQRVMQSSGQKVQKKPTSKNVIEREDSAAVIPINVEAGMKLKKFHTLKKADIDEPASGGRMNLKGISIDDFDKQTARMLHCSYENQHLLIENFNKVKVDMKMVEKNIQSFIKDQLSKFRNEVRTALQTQL